MSDNLFTLDDIRAAADQQFGKMEIKLDGRKKTVLESPLRLPEEKRERVFALVEDIQNGQSGEESDLTAVRKMGPQFREFLLLVGDHNTQELLDALGDDLGQIVALFMKYQEAVGLGEA